MNIRNLIEHLPFYFKSNDTYKVNGKGILERFLEICGDYFTDNIKSNIDNSLEVLDVGTTSQEYLTLIWELLGEIPFAKIPEVTPLNLTQDQQRALIRYTNELLKIRGSKEFFEVMFRIYSNSTNELKLVSIVSEDFGWEKDPVENTDRISPYFDSDYLDEDVKFDEYFRMKQCINVTFTITGKFGSAESSAQKAIKAFIQRYVPYNVNPIVILNGVKLYDTYTLVVEYFQDGEWILVNPEKSLELFRDQVIKVRAYLIDSWGRKVDGKIKTNLDSTDRWSIRDSYYEFYIKSVLKAEDKYTFRYTDLAGENQDRVIKVKAVVIISKIYHLELSQEELIMENRFDVPEIKVDSYYTKTGDSKKYGTPVILEQSGVIKSPAVGTTETVWSFIQPGEYTFILKNAPYIKKKFTLKYGDSYFRVLIAEAVLGPDGKWTNKGEYTDNLEISCNDPTKARVIVEVSCSDPTVTPDGLLPGGLRDDRFTYFVSGQPGIAAFTGSTFTPKSFDTYEFIPSTKGKNDRRATLKVVSDLIRFNTYLSKVEKYPSIVDNSDSTTYGIITAVPITNAAKELVEQEYLDWAVEIPTKSGVQIVEGAKAGTDIYVYMDNHSPRNLIMPLADLDSDKKDDEMFASDDKLLCIIRYESHNSIRIIASYTGAGVYRAWPLLDDSTQTEWEVNNVFVPEQILPTEIQVFSDDPEGWTGLGTPTAVFQLSDKEKVAHFTLRGVYIDPDTGESQIVSVQNYFIRSNDEDNVYYLDEEYTISKPKSIVFGVQTAAKSWKCSVEVKDYDSVVELKCKPKEALLNNGQATTQLLISSNKEADILDIKLENTNEIYDNGDTFLANAPGEYKFIALLNGEEAIDASGNRVEATFKVTDPTLISVTPNVIEFKADGTPVGSNTINIEAGDNTEWVLVVQ